MTDPTDETQPTPTDDAFARHESDPTVSSSDATAPGSGSAPTRSMPSGPSAPVAPSDGGSPPLRANPDRSGSTSWREPPWIPARPRDRRPSLAALLVGLGLIALGVYFFVDRTLGIALPSIQWRSLWPIVLIVIGGLILIRSLDRRR